jgi:hypothetical protein
MPLDPNTSERTEQKLRYVRLTLQEIRDRVESDDHQRAHEEACLFHLIGAFEAVLQELNVVHELHIPMHLVSLDTLRRSPANDALTKALALFSDTKRDALGVAYALRNFGAHRKHAGQVVQLGMGPGVRPQQNSFKDPRKDPDDKSSWIPGTTIEALERWIGIAETVIANIRATYPR